MFDEIKIYWDDSVGDMNLMTDSILGESDWLNDQSLGLENSIWECLSDKGKLDLASVSIGTGTVIFRSGLWTRTVLLKEIDWIFDNQFNF